MKIVFVILFIICVLVFGYLVLDTKFDVTLRFIFGTVTLLCIGSLAILISNEVNSQKPAKVETKTVEVEKLPYTENQKKSTLQCAIDNLERDRRICHDQQKWYHDETDDVYKSNRLFTETDNYLHYCQSYLSFKYIMDTVEGKLTLATNTALRSLAQMEFNNEYKTDDTPIVRVTGNITKVTFNESLTELTLWCLRPEMIIGRAAYTIDFICDYVLQDLKEFGTTTVLISEDRTWNTFSVPTFKVDDFVFEK
jgi:hypothetical protein